MTPDISGPDRNAPISDLAVFQSSRLKLGLDRTNTKDLGQTLRSQPGLRVGNVTHHVWKSPLGAMIVILHGVTGRIEGVKPGHPKGFALSGVTAYGLRMGFGLEHDDYRRIYDLAEANLSELTSERRFSTVVPYNGSEWDVSLDLKDRIIVNLNDRVYKYATDHAIKRAKQRYSLVLTYEAARAMHEAMESGNYVKQEQGRDFQAHTIRATVHYDMEDFTIVYDPQTKMIVTVTPPGDFDHSRKLAGD